MSMDDDTDWEDIAESPTPVSELSAMGSESPSRSSSTRTSTVNANLLRELAELRSKHRRLDEELAQPSLEMASRADKDKGQGPRPPIALRSIPKLVYRSDDAAVKIPFDAWPNPMSPYGLLPGAIRYHILDNFSLQTDQHQARASFLQQLQRTLGPWSAEENPMPVIMFLPPEASRFQGAPRAVVDVRFITPASCRRAFAMAPQLTWDDQAVVQYQQRPWCYLEGLVIVFAGPEDWEPEISNKCLAEHLEPFGSVVETWTTSDIALYDSTIPAVPTGELHVLFKLAPGVEASELPGWMTLRQGPIWEPERFQLYYEGRLDDSERSGKDKGSSIARPSPVKPLTSSPATPSARQSQESSVEPSNSSASRQPQQSSTDQKTSIEHLTSPQPTDQRPASRATRGHEPAVQEATRETSAGMERSLKEQQLKSVSKDGPASQPGLAVEDHADAGTLEDTLKVGSMSLEEA